MTPDALPVCGNGTEGMWGHPALADFWETLRGLVKVLDLETTQRP